MKMDEGLDTGPILLKEEFSISQDMSIDQLHDKCATIGGELLLDAIANIQTID